MNRAAKEIVIAGVSLLVCPFALAAEKSDNTLFEQLRGGLSVTSETNVPLPAPAMADGLDAGGQQEVLTKIVGNRFTVKEFVGKVGTAPHVYNIRKIPAAGEDAPRVYGVDVSFVAHGGLDTVAQKDFLEDIHKKQKDRKIHLLTTEEMKKRKLTVQSDKHREERYSHGVFLVLDRVELSAALHTIVTRQPDSLLAATRIDPHFVKDGDFPNQWRKITIDEEGQRKLGPAQPYHGAGGYMKITRLHEPKGALFIEYHLIYVEPKGWFSGADPLRPKLPAIIQSEVRTFRQELNKASGGR
ncbi:MAG TPA: hypothetical protein VH643_37035 [Gemmataceae bacterium]|jgi:hypothetical protein